MRAKIEKKIWKFMLRRRINILTEMKRKMSIKHDELSDRILIGMTNGGTELEVDKLKDKRDEYFYKTMEVDEEIQSLECIYYRSRA